MEESVWKKVYGRKCMEESVQAETIIDRGLVNKFSFRFGVIRYGYKLV